VTVGIVGGGQLGRMLGLAGLPLGLGVRFLDPVPEAPAGAVGELVVGAYDDVEALDRFAAGLETVTYEFENVPVTAARRLARRVAVFPPPAALEVAQDRLAEKAFLRKLGVPVTDFVAVDDRRDLDRALASLGRPAILKTRRLGYDGKGQAPVQAPADAEPAWAQLGGVSLLLEALVPFDRELSILAVRGKDGATATYPLVENRHRAGILRLSLAPAPGVSAALQATAEAHARRVLEALDYVGVLAIEWFEVGGRLLANELAPRVHNSGHWTIEGAETSQFENHLRAGLGLPLGGTAPRGVAAMVNLIGRTPAPSAVLAVSGAHLHLYGKTPRAGRKLGHVTLRADDPDALAAGLTRLLAVVEPGPEEP
jgi:5-(carboxyamino)imidazole ribonucleotide synthase